MIFLFFWDLMEGISALDIATRADLYSLGVILYELITGTTPREKQRIKKAALEEIHRGLATGTAKLGNPAWQPVSLPGSAIPK